MLPNPSPNPRLWTEEDCARALSIPKWYLPYKKFIQGDHWQDGAMWVGPKVDPESGEIGAEVMAKVKGFFTSKNVINEIVRRHRDGVVGHPVMWRVVPRRFMKEKDVATEAEQTIMNEVEAALTRWWDERGIMWEIQATVFAMVWGMRAAMRVLIPSEFRIVDTARSLNSLPIAKDLNDAFSMIRVEALPATHAVVYRHPNTQLPIAIVKQVRDDGVTAYQIAWREKENVIFMDLPSKKITPVPMTVLPLAEAILPEGPLLTESLIQNQCALNLAISMVPRSVTTAGFLERIMLNAQPPGAWEVDANGNRTRFVSTGYTVGAGITSWLQGVQYKDELGQTVVKDPSVMFREPIDPKHALVAADGHYNIMLSEAHQEHVLTNTEALMSGKSREHAAAGFAQSLRPTKNATESMVATLLESAIGHAEVLLRAQGRYLKDFRVVAMCRVDIGPSSSADREQDRTAVDNNMMSIETAMERASIVDVDAERSRISNDPLYKLRILKQQVEVLKEAFAAGLPLEAVAKHMNMDPALVREITQEVEEQDRVAEEERKNAAKTKPVAKAS
jgi:hypothetical protein